MSKSRSASQPRPKRPALLMAAGAISTVVGTVANAAGLAVLGILAFLVGALWLAAVGVKTLAAGTSADEAPRRPTASTAQTTPVKAPNAVSRAAPAPRERSAAPLPAGWPTGKDITLKGFDLWGQTGWPNQEIVGENHRRDAVRDVFRAHGGRSGGETAAEAVLVPEPGNPYDRNAVRVDIDGKAVGYLPREDAARYADVLQRMILAGLAPLTTARLWARNDSGTWRSRITLDLAEPHLIFPINPKPTGRTAELPPGTTFQVTGEELHLDVLAPLVTQQEAPLWVALRRGTVQGARSVKEVVEVYVNGSHVGHLSAAKGQEYTPLLTTLEEHGVTAIAHAKITGNSLAVNISINAARPSDIPQSWIDEHASAADGTPAGGAPDLQHTERVADALTSDRDDLAARRGEPGNPPNTATGEAD